MEANFVYFSKVNLLPRLNKAGLQLTGDSYMIAVSFIKLSNFLLLNLNLLIKTFHKGHPDFSACSFCNRPTPPIEPEILRTMVVRHFIGYAPNPGNRKRNQVIFMLVFVLAIPALFPPGTRKWWRFLSFSLLMRNVLCSIRCSLWAETLHVTIPLMQTNAKRVILK